MKKSCCIDDANISPRIPSCSMILRSDCSHGPSFKSPSISKEKKKQSIPLKRKFLECCHQLYGSSSSSSNDSAFYSKSSEKYNSNSEEDIDNQINYSRLQGDKHINGNTVLFEYEKYPAHKFINNNSIRQEECSYVNNFFVTKYCEMSKSSNFHHSVSAVNALSESENEDCLLQDKVRRRRSTKSNKTRLSKAESLVSNNLTSTKNSSSAYDTAHSSSINSHAPISSDTYRTPSSNNNHKIEYNHKSDGFQHYSPDSTSPVIDISTVQYTPFDRFRWFLWRSIYLKIIKCVNFDVWLLSRLHNFKKLIILLFLLPLLVYLIYGALLRESKSDNISDIFSNVFAIISYMYSVILSPFSYIKEFIAQFSLEKFIGSFYSIILAIFHFFSSLVVKNNEKSFENPTHTVFEAKSAINSVDLNLITTKMFEEKFKDLIAKFQESQLAHSQTISTYNEKIFLLENGVNKIQKDIIDIHLQFQTLTESLQRQAKDLHIASKGSNINDETLMKAYKDQILSINEKIKNFENIIGSTMNYEKLLKLHSGHIESLNTQMKNFEDNLSVMRGTLKSCCDEKWTIADFTKSFDEHFLAALKNMIKEDKTSPYFFFYEWLQTKLADNKKELSHHMKSEFEKLHNSELKLDEKSKRIIESVVQQHMQSFKENVTRFSKVGVVSEESMSLDLIRQLIKEAIMLYDADKTGLVDYALESGGGSVLSTRCSENYAEKDGTLSVLGFSLWSTHNSPRTAIQPDMHPGQCWAFKGSQGFLVIQLAYMIHPTGFTLEHIPVSLSPSGSIDSAPKEFSVWGLLSEKDNEGILLGKYSYNQDGDPLQYFSAQHSHSEPFSFVELKIHSNHGNLDYTCLYRFRVHGNKPKH